MDWKIGRKKKEKEKEEPVEKKPDIPALVEAIPELPGRIDLSRLRNQDLVGEVHVYMGDVTKKWESFNWHVIIVPEYPDRACETGLGGALSRKNGKHGMAVYDAYAKKHGPLEYGTVVLTPAGQGKDMLLAHVVSLGAGKYHDFETVKTCVRNVYHAVKKNSLASRITIPVLNTGRYGTLTDEQSAKAILSGIASYWEEDRSAPQYKMGMEASIIVYNRLSFKTFEKVFDDKTYYGADDTQPGEHTPDEDYCLIVEKHKDPRINAVRRQNGKNEPSLA